MNFGEFINQKRVAQKITIRDMATRLGLSPAYLTDIEHDRRNPPEKEKLEKLAAILDLSTEERNEMMNLAGRKRGNIAPDLTDYVVENDYVSAALRTARDLGAGEKEWQEMLEELKRRKG